jgi:hypothetical protein
MKYFLSIHDMRSCRISLGVAGAVLLLCVTASAAPFVVFPKAGQLVSPDGRLVVGSVEHEGAASDFVGTFHSLWLTELATGHSRKLCDYLGVAAVAWSSKGSLVVTEYVGKRTSRAWVFLAADLDDPVMLDKPTLTRLVPVELRSTLRGNNHVFVEASQVEEDTLHLRVWGYGQHDASGFRWRCEYALVEGAISCVEESGSH